jgi:hypothetical protein
VNRHESEDSEVNTKAGANEESLAVISPQVLLGFSCLASI